MSKLSEIQFDFHRYSPDCDEVTIPRREGLLTEVAWWTLAGRDTPIAAPFRKLVVHMSDRPTIIERAFKMGSIAFAYVRVIAEHLSNDEQAHWSAAFIEAGRRAAEVSCSLGTWATEDLADVWSAMEAASANGMEVYDVRRRKRDRKSKRSVVPVYRVSESAAHVGVAVLDARGQEVRRVEVASASGPLAYFAIWKSVQETMEDGKYIARDAVGRTVVSVDARA